MYVCISLLALLARRIKHVIPRHVLTWFNPRIAAGQIFGSFQRRICSIARNLDLCIRPSWRMHPWHTSTCLRALPSPPRIRLYKLVPRVDVRRIYMYTRVHVQQGRIARKEEGACCQLCVPNSGRIGDSITAKCERKARKRSTVIDLREMQPQLSKIPTGRK